MWLEKDMCARKRKYEYRTNDRLFSGRYIGVHSLQGTNQTMIMCGTLEQNFAESQIEKGSEKWWSEIYVANESSQATIQTTLSVSISQAPACRYYSYEALSITDHLFFWHSHRSRVRFLTSTVTRILLDLPHMNSRSFDVGLTLLLIRLFFGTSTSLVSAVWLGRWSWEVARISTRPKEWWIYQMGRGTEYLTYIHLHIH